MIELDTIQQKLWDKLSNIEHVIPKKSLSSLRKFFFKSSRHNIKKHGFYIYGPVGTGKSMLSKRYFEKLPNQRKMLIHFHDFMQDVHQQIKQARLNKERSNPITQVAKSFAKLYDVIILDELEINDITDAMIVGKLFAELFAHNLYVVITSNRHPDDLYQDGLQRDKFVDFINLLTNHLELFNLDNQTDYRLEKLSSVKKVFFQKNDVQFEELFAELCEFQDSYSTEIKVNGRILSCPITYKNIALFKFDQLCKDNLSTADYIALCKNFSVIFIDQIEQISPEQNDQAVRFINLIDELYQHHILLVCRLSCTIGEIYQKGRLSFKFERTMSRLIEMQSEEYIKTYYEKN